MSKLPSFQFYPGDWLKDPNLRRCSHAAKGVWIDMLCLMFEAEERGVLASNGVAWSDEEVACAIGGNSVTTLGAIAELTSKGVVKRRANGALYSSRLVRDENKRKLCSEAGKRGGGNPKLRPKDDRPLKVTFKGSSKGTPKGEFKGRPKASSSSSDNNINPPLSSESSPPSCECSIPTLDEVLEYASLPDVSVLQEEAKRFFYKRAEEHWRDRFGRVIDWRASLRGWKSNPFYGQKTQKSKEHCEKSNDRNAGTLNDPSKYDIDGNWKPSY